MVQSIHLRTSPNGLCLIKQIIKIFGFSVRDFSQQLLLAVAVDRGYFVYMYSACYRSGNLRKIAVSDLYKVVEYLLVTLLEQLNYSAIKVLKWRFNCFFSGASTTNFTATNQLFLSNPQINLWQFEVAYTFSSDTSLSSIIFVINQPPYNGSCSISPLNGTTSTLFDISCCNWFDEDGMTDYSVYGVLISSLN